jgi:hypothetical protein
MIDIATCVADEDKPEPEEVVELIGVALSGQYIRYPDSKGIKQRDANSE